LERITLVVLFLIGLWGFGSAPATAHQSAADRITDQQLDLLHQNICPIENQLVAAAQPTSQLPWAQGQD
jgi:hypothetical protein